jgi:SSS family solute:Na+ symporter
MTGTYGGLAISGFIVFIVLFVVFAILGFAGRYFRKGDETQLNEWALAGRKLGVVLTWFLIGADLYTAYTFIAIPSALYANGGIYFFAVPYVALTFAVAMMTMPKLWVISKKKGYITAADFVADTFSSKTLGLLIALTGIVSELPYVGLQLVGMKAVLTMMFPATTGNIGLIVDFALIISVIILIAFTFMSGLRGVTLTALFKDVIIFTSVIVVIIAVPLAYGGFQHAFSVAAAQKTLYSTLSLKSYAVGYPTLWVGSALALYLYPHAVNGSLSSKNSQNLRMSTALLPIYGIGLALLALFGVLIFAVPQALNYVQNVGDSGVYIVPALILYTMPSWFSGFAFLGIFIGGLVPAAIMSMASANLFIRNVFKPYIRKNLDPKVETLYAKITTIIFIFIAVLFTLVVNDTYAIQLQLLAGGLILETLPALFLGLYWPKLNKHSMIVGWAVGMFLDVYLELSANITLANSKHSSFSFATSFFNFGALNGTEILIFVGLFSVMVNVIISVIGTYVTRAMGIRNSKEEAPAKAEA